MRTGSWWRAASPIVAALLLFSSNVARADTLAAFWLPTRSIDGARRAQLSGIAAAVARRLGATVVVTERRPELHDAIASARGLMLRGALDESAALLDRALGKNSIEHLGADDQADFIAGAIRRVSIALARGEVGLARDLLSRVWRADPTLELAGSEKTPPLRAALADVQAQLGPEPKIEPSDLGDACRAADVLIVARPLRTGTQIVRFDECKMVATATMGDDAVGELSSAPLHAHETEENAVTLTRAEPKRSVARIELATGSIAAIVGIALVSAGSYFAAHAVSREHGIESACTPASPCTSAYLQTGSDDYDRSRLSASVLVPVGVAALVTSVALLAVGIRERRKSRSVAVVPAGAFLVNTWTF